jgi:transglutaminase-like putative cysteine protease
MFGRGMGLIAALVLLAGVAGAHPAKPDRPHRWNVEFEAPGGCVTGAAFGDGVLYLADRQADRIYATDPSSGEVLREIPLPGYVPLGLAHDGTHLWLADGVEKKIYRLDPEDGTVTRSFDSPARDTSGLAHDGTDLWIADRKGKELHRVSVEDGTTIDTVPGPAGKTTGLTWDGAALWAADRIEDEVYRVDPRTGNVTLILEAGGEHAWGLAWDGQRLLNADYQSDVVLSVIPGALPLFDLLEDRREKVTFHHEVRVYGPEPLLEATISLAIPRDRPGQQVEGSISFEPAPAEIVQDSWGQDVARFRFEDVAAPGEVGAVMGVTAHTWTVRYYLFPEKTGDLDEIPRDVRRAYLIDGDKYRLDDPLIQRTVAEVVGDETNAYQVMRALYDHILDSMHYELAGGWNVAPAVLERGSGSCSEYTFVFIALCRAAGLPARYVGSVVRRYDDAAVDDVFHRWAEVYLPPYGWVPVDASRGDKPTPAEQASSIGHLDSGLVVTTESGGASDDLGWTYNSASRLTTRGPAKVVEEVYAEWEPAGETEDDGS